MALEEKKSILLTFDVEDWFQVENFKAYIKFSTWNSFQFRVEKNTHKILDLLDSFAFKPKATFFILGWLAKKVPDLVIEIHRRGHEVASHGVDHHLCKNLSNRMLLKDLLDSKKILEDIISDGVAGYRAPSFAINDSVLESIFKAGYLYDSSYNSFSGHDRYGKIDLSAAQKKDGIYQIHPGFYELPISNQNFFDKVLPLGGGGYFRLLPLFLFKLGMKSILKKENSFVFYSHPWEFDPEQPRVRKASRGFKFRHYVNLHQTEKKLQNLINDFSICNFVTCKDYLSTY